MISDTQAHPTSVHDSVDPTSALSPPLCVPFVQGIPVSSSQAISTEERHLEAVSCLPQTIIAEDDFNFSSCDEDADGEPDESFHSEHSFWMTHPGDTSASTVATLDVDDHPIPLLGRDGTWKGVQQYKSPALKGDNSDKHDDQDDDPGRPRPCVSNDKILEPTVLHSPPSKNTRSKRAPSVLCSDPGEPSRSTEKKRRTEKDRYLLEHLGSGKPLLQTKRAGKYQHKRSELLNITTFSDALGSNHVRNDEASNSEAGSVSGASALSSPASSSGRYKLRKKDEVPKQSLAALLTPPRDRLFQSSDESVDGSADWLDEVSQGLHVNTEAALEPSPTHSDTFAEKGDKAGDAQDQLDELEEIASPIRPNVVREKGRRTFPSEWEMHPEFPLLYQRYCVPSSVSPEVLEMLLRGLDHTRVDDEFHEVVDRAQTVQGAFNKPRSILDLYTPRFVKGLGAQKVGMCPVCYEDGKVKFLKTKFSAYNYHMQNFHGISAMTGLPFTPPSKFRTKTRPYARPKERKQLLQGLCHSCNKYIDVQGPKKTDVKVAEIYWWKHAQVCHRSRAVPEGVGGYFVQNKWFERVCSVLELIDGYDMEIRKLLGGGEQVAANARSDGISP